MASHTFILISMVYMLKLYFNDELGFYCVY